MSLFTKLNKIQKELNAPKSQRNNFGKYNYRSCEDILSAVKPLLDDNLVVTLCDDLVLVGDRFYIKSVAKITDGKESVENTAFAREQYSKKGMDEAQITGTASSYARKYALNGLFAIDDAKDADTQSPDDNEKAWLDLDKNMEAYHWIEGQVVNGKPANDVITSIRKKYKVNKETEQFIRSMWK